MEGPVFYVEASKDRRVINISTHPAPDETDRVYGPREVAGDLFGFMDRVREDRPRFLYLTEKALLALIAKIAIGYIDTLSVDGHTDEGTDAVLLAFFGIKFGHISVVWSDKPSEAAMKLLYALADVRTELEVFFAVVARNDEFDAERGCPVCGCVKRHSTLECGHPLCEECELGWRDNCPGDAPTCPLCRAEF